MLRTNRTRAGLLILILIISVNLKNSIVEGSCPVSTIPKNVILDFKWDPSNPDEVARGANVTLKVEGGSSPYVWSVSGAGFTLAMATTEGLSNTLNADNTACVATVTVTDNKGIPVSGDVRAICSGCDWVFKGNYCGLSGKYDTKKPWQENTGGFIYEKYQGNKRQRQQTLIVSGSYFCDGETPCTSACASGFSCVGPNSCISCIEERPDMCGQYGYCICTAVIGYYEYECPQ